MKPTLIPPVMVYFFAILAACSKHLWQNWFSHWSRWYDANELSHKQCQKKVPLKIKF